MKTNQTNFVRSIPGGLFFAVALAFLPSLALAQPTTNSTPDTTGPSTSEQKPGHAPYSSGKALAVLTSKLNLSDAQQAQIQPLLEKRDAKLNSIHSETGLTDGQKHDQSKALFVGTDKQIKEFLNPTQVSALNAETEPTATFTTFSPLARQRSQE